MNTEEKQDILEQKQNQVLLWADLSVKDKARHIDEGVLEKWNLVWVWNVRSCTWTSYKAQVLPSTDRLTSWKDEKYLKCNRASKNYCKLTVYCSCGGEKSTCNLRMQKMSYFPISIDHCIKAYDIPSRIICKFCHLYSKGEFKTQTGTQNGCYNVWGSTGPAWYWAVSPDYTNQKRKIIISQFTWKAHAMDTELFIPKDFVGTRAHVRNWAWIKSNWNYKLFLTI